jgi:hypothetical protein
VLSSGFRSEGPIAPRPPPPRPARQQPPDAVAPETAGPATFTALRVTRVRPWARLLALRDALEPALATIAAAGGQARAAIAVVQDAGAQLQRLCALDPDAMLAVPLLLEGGYCATRHALSSAVVLEFMLARHGTERAKRRSAVRAALTMNVGMHALQEALHAHAGALTPGQRAAVLAHPSVGAARLREAGVDDACWLDVVVQHHEHADGSGYPWRIGGAALRFEAQALMIAERWCAMVAPRAYRPGAPPDRALDWLLSRLGGQADPRAGALLADAVGPTPPGTPVRLVDGELGLVWRRTAQPNEPLVRVLRTADGLPIDGGVCRASSDPRYRIAGCEPRAALGAVPDPVAMWEASEMAAAG